MIRLAIGTALAIALYSGGWYYMAGQAKSWLEKTMAQTKEHDVAVACPNLDIRGYPFRIGAFCSGLKIDAEKAGLSASFGEIRSAAQIYNPGHAVIEIDGPADIRTSFGFMANATWTKMRSSVVGGFSGLERSSLETDDVHADLGDPLLPTAVTADFKHGELHVRQNGNDMDVAVETDALQVQTSSLPLPLPVADIITDITFTDQAEVLKGTKPFLLRASQGVLKQANIDFRGDGAVNLTGPFSFDDQGLLTGTFDVRLSKIDDLKKVLAASFPAAAEPINQVASVLSGLSAGSGTATIKVNVRKGVISVAFFELGRIPPIQ